MQIEKTVTYKNHPLVLFDGVCNLCDWSIRFILSHEAGPEIRFAAIQSEIGQSVLETLQLRVTAANTIVFIAGGEVSIQSGAIIRIAGYLRPPWKWIQVLRFMPRVIRDFGYDLLARNRYRLFGKNEQCYVPTPETHGRFLD
jgi:predicted DCC family thiol-disulfide oxidoreductase YuxK